MRVTKWVLGLFFVLQALLVGCKDDETSIVDHKTNPDEVPTMVSNHVQTVISDSGRTKYRITTNRWEMFEEAKSPHWIFPDGVIAEELVSPGFEVVTSLKCDSAYYDEIQQLWSLNGNVSIANGDGTIILTDQMYWDQKTHELYSEAFIHIERQAQIIEGYGYRSDDSFKNYTLRQVKAIVPIDEDRFPRGGQ